MCPRDRNTLWEATDPGTNSVSVNTLRPQPSEFFDLLNEAGTVGNGTSVRNLVSHGEPESRLGFWLSFWHFLVCGISAHPLIFSVASFFFSLLLSAVRLDPATTTR